MNYKSLSELLEEERALCAGLQTRANIVDAMCEVDLEDPERAEKHRVLRERLVRELAWRPENYVRDGRLRTGCALTLRPTPSGGICIRSARTAGRFIAPAALHFKDLFAPRFFRFIRTRFLFGQKPAKS